MLLEKEVNIGDLYAWDTSICAPRSGCTIFKILEDHKGKKNNRLVVESIDGHVIFTTSPDTLIPMERAIKRLNVLLNLNEPKRVNYGPSELDYLVSFKRNLDKMFELI